MRKLIYFREAIGKRGLRKSIQLYEEQIATNNNR
jgi:hypothetical protein